MTSSRAEFMDTRLLLYRLCGNDPGGNVVVSYWGLVPATQEKSASQNSISSRHLPRLLWLILDCKMENNL